MTAHLNRRTVLTGLGITALAVALGVLRYLPSVESDGVVTTRGEGERNEVAGRLPVASSRALPPAANLEGSGASALRLRVAVRGEEGTPVADARVTVRAEPDLLFKETDADGWAAVELRRPGHVFVHVTAEGYGEAATDTDVAEAGGEVEVVLVRSSALSGRVVGYTGQPTDLTVLAAVANEPGRVQTATLSPGGQFRFAALPPGSYIVGLNPPAFEARTVEVQLEPGERREVELALVQTGALDLTAVLPPNAGPPRTASLRLVRSAERLEITRPLALASGETQRIEGVPVGRFGVELKVDGLAQMPFQSVEIAPDRASALSFIWPTGRITGRISTSSGPAGAAMVGAFKVVAGADGRDVRDNNPEGTAQANPDGSYVVTGLSAGRYVVAVQRGALIAAQEVALGEEEQRTVDVTLDSGRMLLARVLYHGEPVEGARVLAASMPYAENARSAETDAHGLAQLRHLTGGPYLVRAMWFETEDDPPRQARAEVNLEDGTGDVVLELN